MYLDVLKDVIQFLDENTTEIVFLRIKKAQGGDMMSIEDLKTRVIKDSNLKLVELKSALAHTNPDEVKDKTIEEIVESKKRLVFMFVGDANYHVDKTYKDINAAKPETLIENIQEYSEIYYDGRDSGNYRWLSMQVTAWMKAFFTGYQERATESADCALSDPDVLYNITKVTRKKSRVTRKKFNKLYNFVGMDMVGTSRQISSFIKKIIKANQVEKHIFPIRRKKSKKSLLTISEEERDSFPNITPKMNDLTDDEGSVSISELDSDSSRRRLQVCMYDHELRQLLATTKN